MVTSLASQLAQIAANSKSTLNLKAQKAAHSKSLIWDPRVAATQSYQSLYTTCYQGFEELCQLDDRFLAFDKTIFSEDSKTQDRAQLTQAENEVLDKHVEAFLRLAGGRLRLMPAIKSVEWLIRRFRFVLPRSCSPILLTVDQDSRRKHYRLDLCFPPTPCHSRLHDSPLDSASTTPRRLPISRPLYPVIDGALASRACAPMHSPSRVSFQPLGAHP
jgi:U3 small nucleolar RNA-associated protein 10